MKEKYILIVIKAENINIPEGLKYTEILKAYRRAGYKEYHKNHLYSFSLKWLCMDRFDFYRDTPILFYIPERL